MTGTKASAVALATVAATVLSVCGLVGTPTRAEATAAPTSGDFVNGLVDIGGGRQMYVECRGEGSPTAVLIAGKGNGADDWMQILKPDDPAHSAAGDDLPLTGELVHSDAAVFPQVAGFTRVCAYDRPNVRVGVDATTPREQPHTVDADVTDLAAMFAAIGETGPKVLVAHSYGGVIALLYARTHPSDVAGLVMVDALAEDMKDVADPEALAYWDATNAMTSEQVREGIRVIDAIDRIHAAPPLRPMPEVVLVSDKPWRSDLLPADVRDKAITFANWTDHLVRFATRTNARLTTDTNSGHDIYLYNPSLVIDAIRSVVDDVRAGQDAAQSAASFDRATNARLAAAFRKGFRKSGAAGATVGVWIPGVGSFVASRGVADGRTGRLMTPQMQAPIGSITKVFTGQVALQLVDEGVIGLDDTIDRWFPKYPRAAAITVRMLMNHSSGIGDISEAQIEIKCGQPHRKVSPDALIAISARTARAPFHPGRGSSYSSANTILLGRILEKVTGKSYLQLLDQRVLTPLGLTRTHLDTDGLLVAPYSHGYTDMCAPEHRRGIDTSSWTMIAFSAGALASTIDDLHTFGVAFGEGYGLSDRMRHVRVSDTSPGDDASGLGLVVERDSATGSVLSIGHAGSEPGFGANLLYFPCSGAVFAAMVNADFSPSMTEILRAVQPVVQELAGKCAR